MSPASRAETLRRALRAALLARAPRLWARVCSPDDRELGALGEELAARHLAALGWRVLARRLATPAAEVDLVARDGRVLVAVEVKSARRAPVPRPRGVPLPEGAWDRPGRRLARAQLARLEAAAAWLAAREGSRARVDLVEVRVGARGEVELTHERDLRAFGR